MSEVNCRCFHYYHDGDRQKKTCVCGHDLDEHDEFLECEAMFVVPNLSDKPAAESARAADTGQEASDE